MGLSETPKRGRGRPRIHGTPEEARAAAIARATAHTRVRRLTSTERTLTMTPETRALADALVERRGLDGYSGLFAVLVEEEEARGR